MHYDTEQDDHGLPHNPFKSCVVPRPIGWISTTGPDGIDNLAPYSQFQNLTYDPPMVMFSANQNSRGQRKDTVNNAEAGGEFVWNMATWDLRQAVSLSSTPCPPDTDEFTLAGLSKAPSLRVRAPRVAESPVHFECRYLQTIRLPGDGIMGSVDIVIGRVLVVHIRDEVLTPEGRIDVARIRPLARLGYHDYTCVEKVFEIPPPEADDSRPSGMMGDRKK